MCLLIYKPKGKNIPSIKTLRAAAKCNPHGFGFATPTKYFRSLNYDIFENEIQKVKKDEPCIIHLRYATHGSIKTSNCHPFKKDGITFAHNGVLSISPIGDKTDSETAFLTTLHPLSLRYGIYSREVSDAVRKIIGSSKFALMNPSGEVKLFGNFTRLEDGNFYSNLRFQFYTDLFERYRKVI